MSPSQCTSARGAAGYNYNSVADDTPEVRGGTSLLGNICCQLVNEVQT